MTSLRMWLPEDAVDAVACQTYDRSGCDERCSSDGNSSAANNETA